MAKHALVIGITQYDYPYNFQSLTKPVHDAEAVARLLDERGGFQKVTRLPEGWNYEGGCPQVAADRVTSEQLMQALQTFLEEAGRGDALIYFSGHGFVVPDKLNQRQNRKKGYLVTSDSQIETIAVHGIPFDSLNDFFHNSNLSSLVLLLDCCHAGSYLERDLVEQTLTAFGSQKDYYLMAACRATEKAYEGEPEQENSVFTAALLEGLAQERADQDGQISCDRLFDFIYKSKKLRNFGQQPIRLGLGGSITLVTYPIENKEPAKLNRQNPYQGLRAFESEQAPYFYGRDRVIRELLVRLNKDRFLSVIGPSGSGKSSVVKAGLLPQLKSNRIAESSKWEIESFTPGRHPLTPLQEIFARQHRRNQPYVLFIDQFEEVFTLCENEEERQTFLRLITNEATSTERLARVIWAMRGDFLDRCAAYPEPATLINSTEPRTYIVPPFSLQELEEAIKKPAERHGVTFEGGLIAQILEDVEGEPGALPLLQYALSQLWRVCVENSTSEQPQLTQKGYKEIGGVKGALNEKANNIYQTRLPEDQVFIRDLFMQLVQVEEDTVTRRPISWERLDAIANSPEQAQRVVDLLANQRLLVTDEKNVQVVHEALLSEWVLLRKWIEDNREDIRLSRRLEAYCQEWQESFNQAENALLPDAWLAPIEDWVKRTQHQLKLTPLEAEYLQRSIEKRDHEIQSELARERKLRELAEAKAIAEREKLLEAEARAKAQEEKAEEAIARAKAEKAKTQAEVQRKWVALMAVLGMSMLTGISFLFGYKAEASKRKAIDVVISEPQKLLNNGNQLDAAIASIKALNHLKEIEGEKSMAPDELLKVISQIDEHNRLESEDQSEVTSVSFSPDNNWIASAQMNGAVKLWNLNGKFEKIIRPPTQKNGVLGVTFGPDSQSIATANQDGTVTIWNLDGSPDKILERLERPSLYPLKEVNKAVSEVSFSSDNNFIVASYDDGHIRLWRRNGEFIKKLNEVQYPLIILGVTFSPDSQSIASAHADGYIRLWKSNGDFIKELKDPDQKDGTVVHKVKFSSDSKLMASAHGDGTLRVWNLNDNSPVRRLRDPNMQESSEISAYSISFSSDDRIIAAGYSDNKIRIWFNQEIQSNKPKELPGHSQLINCVTFNKKGNLLASASNDGTVRIWQVNSDKENLDKLEESIKTEDALNKVCNNLKDYMNSHSGVQEESICDEFNKH